MKPASQHLKAQTTKAPPTSLPEQIKCYVLVFLPISLAHAIDGPTVETLEMSNRVYN